MSRLKPLQPPAPRAAPGPNFRSGAVARLAHMPVATLRIWEQRYQAVRPATAPSGHRLYSPSDVQRVLLLRQLTERGHAIGSIAALGLAQLQEVANTPTRMSPAARTRRVGATTALRLVVVGPALALRLERPAVAQRLARPAEVVAVFASLAEAARAASDNASDDGADLLIWQSPELHAEVPPELQAAQDAWHTAQVAVVYRFAGAAARKALADTGAVLVREPPDDEALGAWLASLEAAVAASATASAPVSVPRHGRKLPPGAVSPRRFDDAALTAFAGLASNVACECPRHVAELLMQLSSFEAYSAACINRSPADAELHAYLQRVAGASRALFESALESVARHEGLVLR